MFERFWLWAEKSSWRLAGAFVLIGGVNAFAFFWHYPESPIRAVLDAIFAVGFLGAAGWYVLQGVVD